MADYYVRLAKKLDQMPNGFPATPSGVELRILRKIFSPEDARIACSLRPFPETAAQIAKRFHKPYEVTRTLLDAMARRGQIGSFKMEGAQKYALLPFVVGIYEFQLDRLDKELADLFEEYAPVFIKTLGGHKPALARVIPVNVAIDPQLEVLSYENMRQMIERSRSFALRECLCRKEKALEGHPCSHTLETCLGFSTEEGPSITSTTPAGSSPRRRRCRSWSRPRKRVCCMPPSTSGRITILCATAAPAAAGSFGG